MDAMYALAKQILCDMLTLVTTAPLMLNWVLVLSPEAACLRRKKCYDFVAVLADDYRVMGTGSAENLFLPRSSLESATSLW